MTQVDDGSTLKLQTYIEGISMNANYFKLLLHPWKCVDMI